MNNANGKIRICGRVAKMIKRQMQIIAWKEGRSVSSLVEDFLQEGVKHLKRVLKIKKHSKAHPRKKNHHE